MYRALMQQADQACLIMQQHVVCDCNSGAVCLLGVAMAQLQGMSLWQLCPQQQADGRASIDVWRGYWRQAGQGERVRFEWQFQHPASGLIHAVVALSQWREGGGEAEPYALVWLSPVGSAQAIESELLQKRLEFQTLLDNFPGGVSMIDHSLRFVAWNREMLRLTGFDDDYFQQDAPPNLIDVMRVNIARGEYGVLPPDKTPEQLLQSWMERVLRFEAHHFERTRPNGVVLEVRGAPMTNGGFVTTYQDVTLQHQMKEQLRKQSLLLQGVLENMSAGITVFDEHLRLQLWNGGVVDMLDLPESSFQQGVHFEDLLRIMLARGEYGAVDIEQELASRMAVVRQFKEHRYERTSANGRTFIIHGKPLFANGKMVEFITTLTEITDRKQAEIAEHETNLRLEKLVRELTQARADLVRAEKLASLGSLVAGVAHELSTPLGNCLMMASSVQDAAQQMDDKVAQGAITKSDLTTWIYQTEDAMALLIRNLTTAADLIMRFKQVAINEASSQRAHFNLADLITDLTMALRDKIRATGHVLEVDIGEGIEMDSYPAPLEQVLINFVNNSLMHAFEGQEQGQMHLSAHRINADRVLIEFRDNGRGIDKKNLDRIFDPFFTTKMGQGGTGLGLNISYNIITSLLGGSISVASEPGMGTVFSIQIPLDVALHH
jgi:signal transduction histidine kinase